MRQQHKADDDAAHHVSHYDLEKGQIRVVGEAGNADDGQRAGLGCNNRQRDSPPRDTPPGEKIVPQGPLLLAEAEPEQRDSSQVQRDNREIKMVQTHISIQLGKAFNRKDRKVESAKIAKRT